MQDINQSIDQLKDKLKNQLSIEEQEKKYNKAAGIADWLVEKLNSPDSRAFYCKCAYQLPQGTIDRLVTTALEKGTNPGAYFNVIARKEMKGH